MHSNAIELIQGTKHISNINKQVISNDENAAAMINLR